MKDREILGILLEFGFHEIKKYIHSGFAAKLSEKFDIVWLAIDKGSPQFDSYFRDTGYPLIYFHAKDFRQSDSKIEARNQAIRRNWMISKNLGAFHNYSKVKSKSYRSYIIGSDLLKKIYERKAIRQTRELYLSNQLEEVLREYRVEHLLATGYASVFAKSSFVTADKLSIKTWYLVNSWKDLYINNFLPFDFLNGIFVWSEQMKRDYLYHMPYLDKNKIHVSGNPTFDVLKGSEPAHSRSHYAKKYGIPERADWILYTMMPPGLINDEIETVKFVANDLLQHYTPQEKVIIVRKNPNHSTDEFANMTLPLNTVIAEHYCTFDRDNDMIIQSPEGEQEWIDLLHHCAISLSVPSTVTLEFLTLNKPVINIGFGPDGKPDPRVNQHFEAGFYKPILSHQLVKKVENISNLTKCIISLNEIRNNTEEKPANEKLGSDVILSHLLR
ncbi:MAG: hypothetical protein GT600_16925 [Bacteroidales bacterium]|nr:hypothetical protein [Bacteroidales bacterium]